MYPCVITNLPGHEYGIANFYCTDLVCVGGLGEYTVQYNLTTPSHTCRSVAYIKIINFTTEPSLFVGKKHDKLHLICSLDEQFNTT